MKTNYRITKKALSILLCFALIFSYLPMTLSVSAASSNTVADAKTLGNWENWYPENSSRYAGGVFVDKSVYTADEALSDSYFDGIKNKLSFGQDNFGNDNFMVALSALGSTSEVHGYTHTPTDTMLILDASTSMGTGDTASTAIDDMVKGANDAIKKLLSLNNYNRVGVVIYSGRATTLLPLDSYTSENANGDILRFERVQTGSGRNRTYENRIYIASDVKNGNGGAVATTYVAQAQGTYTQGGIHYAAEEFLKDSNNPVIEDGKIQGGTHRIPIMVLMTDGEPSYRTTTGANTTINKYNNATNENVDSSNFREDEVTAFSTMLTAADAEAKITQKYGEDTRFYTLGYNLSANHQYAPNVLNPLNPNNTDAARYAYYAEQYLSMNVGDTKAFYRSATDNTVRFRVTRQNGDITTLDYVDRYWQASGTSDLTAAFDAIADEIIIQSRYYSTLVSSNQHHQDGYVSFTDEIGTHMEVKNLKGFYIGEDKLVTGGMFAEFATTGSVADYDNENYSADALEGFENEILSAVAERFGITLSQASQLINSAKESGFISYNSKTDFSNYVAWYADKDNKYLAPYTGLSAQAADGAKYIVRSYFYMGDVTQSHVETSMLYALVRVREDIETGRQIVDMNIPAALLPMVTYTINVDGDTLTAENITGITRTAKKPISLLVEVGIDSDITPINISEKVDTSHKNADGEYVFYTNRWRDDSLNEFTKPSNVPEDIFSHGIMNTTVTHFIPSVENERYYYQENAQIYINDGGNYSIYTGAEAPTAQNGDYYTIHTWVEGNASTAGIRTAYNPIEAALFTVNNAIVKIDGKNGWFVKKGSPELHFGDNDAYYAKGAGNLTGTLAWSNSLEAVYHATEGHTGFHAVNYLGNNGMVTVAAAQGIKLTKSVPTVVAGASEEFDFTIELTAPSGTTLQNSYPLYIEYADGTTSPDGETVSVTGGEIRLTLKDGDTAYITGLPTGTEYTVTEEYHSHYAPTITGGTGTIEEYTISSVAVVNTPKGFGSLLVEKDITYPFDTISTELASKEFNFTVTFEGDPNDLAQIEAPAVATTNDNGITYTLKLKDGHDALFTNIPEGVKYTVIENMIPLGFTPRQASFDGTIAKETQSTAWFINDYESTAVLPDISIYGTKTLNGVDWDAGDYDNKFFVELQEVKFGGQETVAVGNPIRVPIKKNSTSPSYSIDMSSISYTAPGSYSYAVYEYFPGDSERVTDVYYDTSFTLFTVEVTDDGSGQLKVAGVKVHEEAPSDSFSGNAQDGWAIEKNFTNNYNVKPLHIPVQKLVTQNGNPISKHSGGIMFALYDSDDANANRVYYTITDENGKAEFILTVKQADFDTEKYYYLREIIPPENSRVPGMTYDDAFKYVVKIHWPNASDEEPTVTYYNYDANATDGVGEAITTVDANNPLTITNTFEDVISNKLVFSGKKTLNGGNLRSGDTFEIKLYKTDASFSLTNNAELLDTATVNSADDTFSFEYAFKSVGTKYMVIAETKGNAAGIGYDTTLYHITVDVSKVLEGNTVKLAATATHIHKVGHGDVTADQINFNNTYLINDTEEVVIKGHKTLNGRNILSNNSMPLESEFEFEISAITAGAPMPAVTRVKNDADGNFSFPAIEYNIVDEESYNKTYEYKVKEVIPATAQNNKLDGVTYTTEEYIVKVTLKDDGFGKITKTVWLDNTEVTTPEVEVSFINSYSAEGTSVTLGGEKTLNGRAWTDSDVFTFELYETDSSFSTTNQNAVLLSDDTFKATKDNKNYSITLNYEQADRGYHYYVLREVVPADTKGISYDITRYDIIINALDNGKGQMEAHIMSIVNPFHAGSINIDELDFTNTYAAAESDPIYLGGTKDIAGKPLSADEFTFELYEANSSFEKLELIDTAKNLADKSFTFASGLTFDKADTYYYVVIEKNDGLSYIGYDNTVYGVTIKVVDDGVGKLQVESPQIVKIDVAANTPATAIEFNNEYKPHSAFADILGQKVLDSEHKTIEADEFEFTISAVTQNAPMPTEATVKNDVNGEFSFGRIEFAKTGEYKYTVTEKNTGKNGYTYDDTVYNVTVTVTDEGFDGQLDVKVEGVYDANDDAIIKFVNGYTPKSVDVTIGADGELSKELDGRDLEANEFEFALMEGTTEKATAKNDADGKFEFTLSYDKAGTYEYTVIEKNNGINGITYDDSVYNVTIEIVDDKGQLKANSIILSDANGNISAIVFENSYDASDADPINIAVKKNVTASEGNSYTLGSGQFKFKIEAITTGAPMPTASEIVNIADGTAVFENIVFTKAGTYEYKVTEVNGGLDYFDYDATEYKVTVKVTDNTDIAKLETEVEITKDSDNAEIIFENKYNPKSVIADILGEKVLDSEHKTIEADEFEFTISAVTQNAPMPTEATVKNDVNGEFSFGRIEFAKTGEYKYTVTEKNTGKNGYTYDDTVYNVTVTVTDEGFDGQLDVKVEGVYDANDDAIIKFVNGYTPKSVDVTIGADGELSKELDGRDLEANEFEFALMEGTTEKATAKNDADGKFKFTLSYDKAGTYEYTVIEKNNGINGITYDDSVYNVTIEIVDKDGQLEAQSVVYSFGTEATESIVFKNTYTPEPQPEPKPEPQPEPQPEPKPEPQPEPIPEDIPESPKTGDSTNLGLWFALLFVSGGGVIGIGTSKKRKEKN